MDEFWKLALGIAGLGAIASFVVWSLYREWLRLPIFQTLTKKQQFTLFQTFLILTFLFGLAGLGTYAFVSLKIDDTTPTEPAELRVQRIRFDETNPRNLDILLQNKGGSAALITKATVDVERIWSLFQDNNVPRRVTPSGKYVITIPVEQVPYSRSADLEQHIPSNNADRILLTLSTPVTQSADKLFEQSQFRHFIYRFHLYFTYNDEKIVRSDQVIDYLPVAKPFLQPDRSVENEQVYKELRSDPRAIQSPKIRELLKD